MHSICPLSILTMRENPTETFFNAAQTQLFYLYFNMDNTEKFLNVASAY